jgi:Uma2 family endonuclease
MHGQQLSILSIDDTGMSTLSQNTLSEKDYLAIERSSAQRHEYYQGEIFAMGGASANHNQIVANVMVSLGLQLKQRPCRVWASDMRVKLDKSGLYTYPDIVAFCGQPHYDDDRKDTLLNPTVIIEVLSPSTEAYDRGEKFSHYRQVDTLREYVLIGQEKPRIERYVRQPEQKWLLEEVSDLVSSIRLAALDCELRLSDVYEKVDL